jgi:hypothetical protein
MDRSSSSAQPPTPDGPANGGPGGVTQPAPQSPISKTDTRSELIREATIMILYVSVVEIAELAAIPQSHFSNGRAAGPVGAHLLEIVWGTAVGLALAHWFAFGFVALAFRGRRPTHLDLQIGLAQLGGAVLVAALSSVPALILSDVRAQETTGDVPAVLLGVVGYLVARHVGSARVAATVYGVTAIAVGVLVALVKTALSAH